MKPTLAWVHESREQMEAIRKFIRSLEEGALDLLGFGRINERYSDLFFPGISTIMTRARYYVFVASACATVEREGKKWGRDAEEEVKRLENVVRKKLAEGGETIGIIGLVRKEELHSYPSDIYWGGLRKLGVFRSGDTKQQYFRRLKSIYLLRSEHQAIESGDEELSGVFTWDPRFEDEGMIDIDESKKITFALGKSESRYLKSKFDAYAEDNEPSLICWLLREDSPIFDQSDWDSVSAHLKNNRAVSGSLAKHVEVATQFRLLAGALEQLYYVMLCERKWGRQSNQMQKAVEYLTEQVQDKDFQRSLRRFDDWLQEATNNDPFFVAAAEELNGTALIPGKIVASKALERLIADREHQTKGSKARLTNADAFEKWTTDDPRGSIPDFRLGIGLRIAQDVREGLYVRP